MPIGMSQASSFFGRNVIIQDSNALCQDPAS